MTEQGRKVKEKRGFRERYYITTMVTAILIPPGIAYIPVYTWRRIVNAVNSKTFKSGNSVAVRLPKEIGFAADMDVVVERTGDVITIRAKHDPAQEKARLKALLDDLAEIGQPEDGVQARDPFEFPGRPGL
jgi:antitoxin VapB